MPRRYHRPAARCDRSPVSARVGRPRRRPARGAAARPRASAAGPQKSRRARRDQVDRHRRDAAEEQQQRAPAERDHEAVRPRGAHLARPPRRQRGPETRGGGLFHEGPEPPPSSEPSGIVGPGRDIRHYATPRARELDLLGLPRAIEAPQRPAHLLEAPVPREPLLEPHREARREIVGEAIAIPGLGPGGIHVA